MSGWSDLICFAAVASAAMACLLALFGAGRSFGLSPLAIIMAKCTGVAVTVTVAAFTGMCRIAPLGAGRRSYDFGIAVCMSVIVVDICVYKAIVFLLDRNLCLLFRRALVVNIA